MLYRGWLKLNVYSIHVLFNGVFFTQRVQHCSYLSFVINSVWSKWHLFFYYLIDPKGFIDQPRNCTLSETTFISYVIRRIIIIISEVRGERSVGKSPPTPPSFELFIRKYTGTTWRRWRKEELHSEDFLSDVAHPVVSDWNKNSVVLLFVDCFSFYSHCLLTEDVAEIIGLWVLEMNWGWVRESRLEPWE